MTEDTWRERAILRTRGNQSLIGAVLLAVLGRSGRPPCVGREATITAQGVVVSSFKHRNLGWQLNVPICMKDGLIGSFRKLADALKLTDAERIELFKELRAWIAKDLSAPYDIEERLGITPKGKIIR